MADSYAVIAAVMKTIIDTEFAAESIVAIHDHLHESRGHDGIAVGISPISQAPMPTNAAVMDTLVKIQFYDLWNKTIDPYQSVDPQRITGFADRFRRKVESVEATTAGSTDVWYFEVLRTDYPHDPTGNKTRFEAQVRARGDNTALTQR